MGPTDARSADAEAFTGVFHACYLDVLNFIARRVGEIHRAEDLTAEVFTRAWQRWPKAPPEARSWLFGIAHHVIADSFRDADQRRRPNDRITQTPGPLSDTETVDHSTFSDMSIDFRRAWAALSVADRDVLSLVAWDGLTGEQAATVLGCSRAAFS